MKLIFELENLSTIFEPFDHSDHSISAYSNEAKIYDKKNSLWKHSAKQIFINEKAVETATNKGFFSYYFSSLYLLKLVKNSFLMLFLNANLTRKDNESTRFAWVSLRSYLIKFKQISSYTLQILFKTM